MAAALLFAASFRVRVVVTSSEAVVTRTVLFALPWRRARHAGRPQAFVDGWGDFADPEAIHLGLDGEDGSRQLAWVNARGTGRSEAFVHAFNAGVDEVWPARR